MALQTIRLKQQPVLLCNYGRVLHKGMLYLPGVVTATDVNLVDGVVATGVAIMINNK